MKKEILTLLLLFFSCAHSYACGVAFSSIEHRGDVLRFNTGIGKANALAFEDDDGGLTLSLVTTFCSRQIKSGVDLNQSLTCQKQVQGIIAKIAKRARTYINEQTITNKLLIPSERLPEQMEALTKFGGYVDRVEKIFAMNPLTLKSYQEWANDFTSGFMANLVYSSTREGEAPKTISSRAVVDAFADGTPNCPDSIGSLVSKMQVTDWVYPHSSEVLK